MNTQDPQPTRLFYWLVTGNIVIADGDNVQAIPQNAMITTDEPNLGVHQLGKAQQALQVTLFKKLGETVNVVDVIITSLMNLGYMTAEEFNFRPDGVAVQEMEKPSADVIDFTEKLNRS